MEHRGYSEYEKDIELPTKSHKNRDEFESSHSYTVEQQEYDEETSRQKEQSFVTETHYNSEDGKAYLRLPDMPDIDFEDLNFPPGKYFLYF